MYSLLIVDDEMHIARGIESSADWRKFGIESVEIAYNIRQAREVFDRHPVDILICDIEMPEGDGFEMLTWQKQHSPATQTIFLTCHAEFEYARKALQLGSLDYMLKPVLPDALEAVIEKAIGAIEKEREQESFNRVYKHYVELWSAHRPLLVERFWQDLLDERIPSELESIRERIRTLGIPLRESTRFWPVLLGVHRWNKELTARERQIMEYALRKAAEETFLIDSAHGHVVPVGQGMQLLIVAVDDLSAAMDTERLKRLCDDYISICNHYLYCQLSCYIGPLVPVQEMKAAFGKLVACDRRNVTLHNHTFVADTGSNSDAATGRGASDAALPNFYGTDAGTGVLANDKTGVLPPQLNVWSGLLQRGERVKLKEEVSAYLDAWRRCEALDRSVLHVFCQEYMHMINQVLRQKGLPAHPLFAEALSPERTYAVTRSVVDACDWADDIAGRTLEYIAAQEERMTLADKVKAYIAQHLDTDFSRQDLADYLNLSPDYVVKLFRKETGMAVSDFIVRERVEAAKSMLAKTDTAISDIALMVGYSNFSYFSKVFKKETDMSPQEFRRKYAGDRLPSGDDGNLQAR